MHGHEDQQAITPNSPDITQEKRSVFNAMLKGAMKKCPSCGQSRVFSGYLSVNPVCSNCHENLEKIKAEDFPPYVTITIVGHIIVPMIFFFERNDPLGLWTQMALWPTLTLLLTLLIMPNVKGSIIGLMWALRLWEKSED
ncbi:DUF983 domain-containing protein [Kiloniella sp. b19]|uniref:DUF983 domain-containing protein n=1 Tax=Kiloniella sp. GXU_MW_B19 TaxID=3141326 RepID=UPI0031DDA381